MSEGYDFKKKLYICEKLIRFYSLKNESPIIPEYIINYLFLDIETDRTYYSKIYKTNLPKEYIITNEKEAIQKFQKNDGIFINTELKNLYFQNLLNDDFVLNHTIH